MNKKQLQIIVTLSVIIMFWPAGLYAGEQKQTPAFGMFYKANELFRDKQYEQALKLYGQILAQGIESGNLYYNIGNAYFKMGKLGEALASYEQAKRLIPQDSDLKANTNFLESLRQNPVLESRSGGLMYLLEYFGDHFSSDRLTWLWVIIYWLLMLFGIAAVLLPHAGPILKNYAIALGIVFLFTGSAWVIKIYDTHVNAYAFIIDEVVEAKFAPSQEATTYFKVYEGARVHVIRQEGKWARIKTPDGKIGWTSRAALYKI